MDPFCRLIDAARKDVAANPNLLWLGNSGERWSLASKNLQGWIRARCILIDPGQQIPGMTAESGLLAETSLPWIGRSQHISKNLLKADRALV